jgi:hypothetical protein
MQDYTYPSTPVIQGLICSDLIGLGHVARGSHRASLSTPSLDPEISSALVEIRQRMAVTSGSLDYQCDVQKTGEQQYSRILTASFLAVHAIVSYGIMANTIGRLGA